MWDMAKGVGVATLDGHLGDVSCVAWSPRMGGSWPVLRGTRLSGCGRRLARGIEALAVSMPLRKKTLARV